MNKRNTGLAIMTILLAVVLLAAIAVSIALSARSGNASTSAQQDKMLASNIVSQAQQLKTSFAVAVSNGADPTAVSASSSGLMTSFGPSSAGIISIEAPVNATMNGQNFYWNGANHPIRIANVGTSAGNYLIELVHLTRSVCQQINLGLFGNTNIPTIATNGWDNNPGDLTNDPAAAGIQEGCFYYAPDPEYFYYKVIMVR